MTSVAKSFWFSRGGLLFVQPWLRPLSMMFIPTGILHIPTLDDTATDAVLGVLSVAGIRVQIVRAQAVPSQRNWITDTLIRWRRSLN